MKYLAYFHLESNQVELLCRKKWYSNKVTKDCLKYSTRLIVLSNLSPLTTRAAMIS